MSATTVSDRVLPQLLKDELNGHPYTLEDGRKHIKIFVFKRLAGVLPKGSGAKQQSDRRVILNIRSQIRRVIQQHKEKTA